MDTKTTPDERDTQGGCPFFHSGLNSGLPPLTRGSSSNSMELIDDNHKSDGENKIDLCPELSTSYGSLSGVSRVSVGHVESVMSAMIDSSLDPMFQIEENGTIRLVNQAATDIFGWQREEFIGHNISMICGGEHRDRHDQYLKRYLITGEPRAMGKRRQLSARRKNDTEFPIELSLTEVLVEEGTNRLFCGFVRDLSLVKHGEEKVRQKESLTVAMIDASFDAMLQIEEHGIIEMVNQAAIDQFGWSYEEFIGHNISMICSVEHAVQHDRYLRRYLETGEKRVMGKRRELMARRKDNSEFPIELGISEVKVVGGNKRLFCGFVRDLTRQKEDEQRLKENERLTDGIVEAAFDPMFAIDEKGIIKKVNKAACTHFGWSREQFMGSNIKMMMTEEHDEIQEGEGILDYLREIMSLTVGEQRETTARKRDGSVFPILLGLEAFEGGDGKKMLVAFARDLTEQKDAMELLIEKNAAEVLLANVLPAEIALRLQNDPTHIADHHKMATVLFGDIVGFTAMSSEMSPGEVVGMLNKLFSLFDTLVDDYDLNKVKTIGDCYMVTSVPVVEHMEDDCSRICHFALDMHDAVEEYNITSGKDAIAIRIGIHTGPVVAGVVGTKRFLYDLWGDAVNVASRMESTGVAGRTQVTRDIVDRVGNAFTFTRRGQVDVKGKGKIETFFLRQRTGRRPSVLTNEKRKLHGLELKSEKDDMSLYTSLRILDGSNGDSNYQNTEDVQGTKDHLQPHRRGHASCFEEERIYDDEDASEK
eukprot:scaffold52139_cov53-Attheya_sp.AAC.1